jgi:hypothetical protein
MRWFLASMIAAVLAFVGSSAAQAGCCCGCGQGSACCPNCPCGATCPNCPASPNPATCPNCAQQTASAAPSPYWSSAYGCYLYYDPATRRSYYWSEANASYYPVQDVPGSAAGTPSRETTSRSAITTSTTLYYSPGSGNGAALPQNTER